MTAQQAAGWSRREFLQRLALAGAAGMAGMSSRPVTAVEVQQTRRPTPLQQWVCASNLPRTLMISAQTVVTTVMNRCDLARTRTLPHG